MADEIDMANEQAERWLNQTIANAAKATTRLAPKGRCYFCEEEFEMKAADADKKLYCDADCAQGHENEQRLKSRR